jgi:plastocyanin domain-containing protein
MPDLQVFLVLSSIVLTTLVLGYVGLALTTQFRARFRKTAVQEIAVMVKGGYSPDIVVVQQGRPVRFSFTRQETAVCSERVLFPDFKQDVSLPAYEPTTVEFTPTERGEYNFHCQMGILHGTLIVK